MAGDAHLFLLPLAFPRRLEQTEYRLRDIRIADEHPLNRPRLKRTRRSRERKIGRVGIHNVSLGIGDREAVIGMVGDAAPNRIVGRAIGEADDAGGESEQAEQPDHRQQREQPKDIGLRLRAPERHQRYSRRDDAGRHQQHEYDAPAAPGRLVNGHRLS